jgi:microcystin degradation protein MlrC
LRVHRRVPRIVQGNGDARHQKPLHGLHELRSAFMMRHAAVLTALVVCAFRAADAAPAEDEVMLFTLA